MSIVCFVSSSVSISNHRLSGEVEGLCGFIEVDWGSIERSQTHIGKQECNPFRADVTDYKEISALVEKFSTQSRELTNPTYI